MSDLPPNELKKFTDKLDELKRNLPPPDDRQTMPLSPEQAMIRLVEQHARNTTAAAMNEIAGALIDVNAAGATGYWFGELAKRILERARNILNANK